MSYYDDYDDDCLSDDDDVYYHNYSVDYANQLLGGHHAITSCLPRTRRKHHRHTPRLVRVSTLDQMPIISRPQIVPSLHSQPKYGNNQEIPLPPSALPSRLPSLEATNEEMERRVSRRPQPILEEAEDNDGPPIINNINDINNNIPTENTHRPLTEDELRQVQQQQAAFQQHLLNMQRRLLEQANEAEERQKQPTPEMSCSTSHCAKKRSKVSFHDLECDDDQAEIAELIENDPYFAAAMEDFAHTHGLLHNHRHRTHSHNSSHHSQKSQHICKRHRTQFQKKPSSRLSQSSSSSSVPSVRNVASNPKGPNTDLILLRELQGIRLVMEEYVREKRDRPSPVYWPTPNGQGPISTSSGIHYPPVPPVTDYQPAMVPRERPQTISEPSRVVYQNVVNAVKEVIDRRSPTQREQPLKPSDIDPKLKHVYTRRPQIPPSNLSRPTQQRQQQPPPPQQNRRRSSESSTQSSTNIPPAPPYESLTNFSSTRSTATTMNQNRALSYGSREKKSHIYDTLFPGHYLRLYSNKLN
ncbi:hypothetical protein I4U23_017341 [Adineta vaga]|nr:hypothetical protein I4U23_017341 [Adineta vaga]